MLYLYFKLCKYLLPRLVKQQPPLWSATDSNIPAVGGHNGAPPFTTAYSHDIRTGGTPKGWLWVKLIILVETYPGRFQGLLIGLMWRLAPCLPI